jgi:hypothetical protein
VFFDSWRSNSPDGEAQNSPSASDSLFLVTPCPRDTEPGDDD